MSEFKVGDRVQFKKFTFGNPAYTRWLSLFPKDKVFTIIDIDEWYITLDADSHMRWLISSGVFKKASVLVRRNK